MDRFLEGKGESPIGKLTAELHELPLPFDRLLSLQIHSWDGGCLGLGPENNKISDQNESKDKL